MPPVRTLFDNTPVQASFDLPAEEIPESAQVLIIGGGIAGTSIAYHFAKAGWKDVYLLEQNRLASGTSWHAAGMVGQLRSSSAQTKVNKESVDLYSRLQSETGHDPGWLQCGSLQLATCQERMIQLQRNVAMANVFGVEAKVISSDECADYWPKIRTDDLLGGVYLPGDGRVLPGECVIALAKGAMQGGVKIIEGVSIEQLLFRETASGIKRFSGVQTNRGKIESRWVVLACNMWMRQLGMSVGIDIPVYPCEHHYLITRPIEGISRNVPCTRDPDAGLYFRALDDGGLKLGAFQKNSKPWQIDDHVPNNFAFRLLQPDWPEFEEALAAHLHRLPNLSRNDIFKFVNGPEAFTPDNNFIMGQPLATEGLFVCGGWNSAGIACSGGAGKYAVEWIENEAMTLDLSSVDVRRFMAFQNDRKYLQHRVSEVLGLHYQLAWPNREKESSRKVRQSCLYELLAQHNACFGESGGWERPLFFAPTGVKPELEYSFVRPNWREWVAEEVKSCRENVGILDQSTFAKVTLTGPDALRVLQRLCGANIDREINRAIYSGMFNFNGTFESDLTVVRTGHDSFYVVSPTAQQTKDFDWILRNINEDEKATLADVTESFNVVSVMGPKAHEVLHEFCPEVFSVSPVSYGIVKFASIGEAEVRAIRISYLGEQGFELHIPTEQTRNVYLRLLEVGADFGIRPIGNYAISAMRIEKGFRALGHELSPAETPLEAGLGWVIDWKKSFIGKSALLKQKKSGLNKRLVCFALLDPDVILWGSEPIHCNGKIAGYTTSACYSPSLSASVALGYVRKPGSGHFAKSDLDNYTFEIEQAGVRHAARASWNPFV